MSEVRLIDANALIDTMYHEAFETDSDMQRWDSGCWIRYKMFENAIDNAPTIEPKQGEWIDKGWHGDWQFETDGRGNCWHEYECSKCGFHNKGSKSNFCPNCGADMRERKDNEFI